MREIERWKEGGEKALNERQRRDREGEGERERERERKLREI